MTARIQLLPDHVANQIAAGEVVQRPASVVKELIENAVDAKATEIKLIIKEAGKTLIQVIDNGMGMSVTDARMSFERHATSKIKNAEDLFDLHTKGFRGEALASIAAVAHVELKTKPEDEELGTHIIIEGSKITTQDVIVTPTGTSFSVKNLFFNIPARRNFLKSDTVEFRYIVDEFQRVALAHPNIHFTMYHNGSEYFNLQKGNLKQRIIGVFGGKTNEKLVPITEDTEIVSIKGFVGKPEFAKKNRLEQFLFVNNRFIKSGYLHHAIMGAYDGLLRETNQPAYFIFLEVPPHTIDINIHPTKTEIKFDDENAIYAILRASIKHSLGQYNVAPVLDFERDANLDIPYNYHQKEAETPVVHIDKNFNPFVDKSNSPNFGSYKKEISPSWESLYASTKNSTEEIFIEQEAITSKLFTTDEVESIVQKKYQLKNKYIISPVQSGLCIIHQNRAHQRVLYEQFLSNITMQKGASQQLLFPLEIALNKQEIVWIKELQAPLENTGFVFDNIINEVVMISGLPVVINENQVASLFENIVSEVAMGQNNSFSQNDTIAKIMAKSIAIPTGKILSEPEIESLVNALFACKEPNVSPFYKPIFYTQTIEEIDKRFNL